MNMQRFSYVIRLCFVCLAFLFCARVAACEESLDSLFTHASELYEKGDYFGSLLRYEELLAKGYASGNLYYNMGNCYVKQDEIGTAILYYERARRLMPRDTDLRANYLYARSLVKTSGIDAKPFWLLRFVRGVTDLVSVNECTVFVSFLFCLLLVVWSLFLARILPQRAFAWIVVSVLVFFSVGVFGLYDVISRVNSAAIVIDTEVPVRFGPFERATTHFTIFEGGDVAVQEEKGMWLKIKRSDGNTGWVARDSIARVS